MLTVQEFVGHADLASAMNCTPVLKVGGAAAAKPLWAPALQNR